MILMTIEVFQAKRETDSLGEAAVSQLPSHNFDPRTTDKRARVDHDASVTVSNLLLKGIVWSDDDMAPV